MTKIYALVNQKGGVGKTTSVLSTGAFLAHSGRRVLLVDMDPQCNATSGLGYDKYAMSPSVYEMLMNEAEPDAVRMTYGDVPLDQAEGYATLCTRLEDWLAEITGFDASCFSGEYVTGDVTEEYLSRLEHERSDGAKAERERGQRAVQLKVL